MPSVVILPAKIDLNIQLGSLQHGKSMTALGQDFSRVRKDVLSTSDVFSLTSIYWTQCVYGQRAHS
jgi:hypothetical protein